MLIELIKDKESQVTGFRYGWGRLAVPPVPENVFEINKSDFNGLVDFLAGRRVVVSPILGIGDFASGNLALIALDIASTEVFKTENSSFFETAKGL
jgi:hypothetical protein